MKTTVELPDALFREAKAQAARQGVSLKDFFSTAVQEHLRHGAASRGIAVEPAWMRAFGGLRDLHRENKRIERVVAAEFERIDEEEWR